MVYKDGEPVITDVDPEKVSYGYTQSLTDEQKKRARNNIGAISTLFCTCDTEAEEKEKTALCNEFELNPGTRVSILFSKGNTYGSCVGTDSNVIAAENAPTLNINNTGIKTIYIGGEPAGEGFINAGDVHDFVYDGEHYVDITADVIYSAGNGSDWGYEKSRTGKIEQWKRESLSITVDGNSSKTTNVNFMIKHSDRYSTVITTSFHTSLLVGAQTVTNTGFVATLRNVNSSASITVGAIHWRSAGF